jgi:FkbM family methyltransferase
MNRDFLEALKVRGYGPRSLLDIGAHIGTFTREFLDIFPDCVPTLIEPNPFCLADLSKLGFELHAVAASNEPGRAELFLTKEWLQSTGSSLYRENTAFFRDEVVIKHEITKARLDDLFRGRRFDFVKIDTQGSELDVILGGQALLRQADYILVEVSLVEYNIGGARAEAVFSTLSALGFHCTEVTDFHRLAGVQNGNLLQMDFVFERRTGLSKEPSRNAVDAARIEALRNLATLLHQQGRSKEALLLLEHLESLQPDNSKTLQQLVRVLGAEGQTLKAIRTLAALKTVCTDDEGLLVEIRDQMPSALQRFNHHVAAGEVEEAEKYVSALATLVPRNVTLLDAALACNLRLGRTQGVRKYASDLLTLDATHLAARAALESIQAADRASGRRYQGVGL